MERSESPAVLPEPAALETAFEHDYPWQYFGTWGAADTLALQEKELGWIRGISVERKRGLVATLPALIRKRT